MIQANNGSEACECTLNFEIKDNWKGEVHDLLLLLEAILDGKAPINLIKVDETALNSIAKSLKGAVNYPGIRFYNDKIMAIR